MQRTRVFNTVFSVESPDACYHGGTHVCQRRATGLIACHTMAANARELDDEQFADWQSQLPLYDIYGDGLCAFVATLSEVRREKDAAALHVIDRYYDMCAPTLLRSAMVYALIACVLRTDEWVTSAPQTATYLQKWSVSLMEYWQWRMVCVFDCCDVVKTLLRCGIRCVDMGTGVVYNLVRICVRYDAAYQQMVNSGIATRYHFDDYYGGADLHGAWDPDTHRVWCERAATHPRLREYSWIDAQRNVLLATLLLGLQRLTASGALMHADCDMIEDTIACASIRAYSGCRCAKCV